MTAVVRVSLVEQLRPDDRIGKGVEQCWLDVSNAGGAVGFPSLPVSNAEVNGAIRRLAQDVAKGSVLVFVAEIDGEVVGWVSLRLNSAHIARHWATVERLQSRPERRGLGIGNQLMRVLSHHARSIGLEQLRLVLRGGEDLEAFYMRLGWNEIGRHPGALRISDGDDRDEVSMMFKLSSG